MLAIKQRLNNKSKWVLWGEGFRQLMCCKLNAHKNQSCCFPVHTQIVLGHPETKTLSNVEHQQKCLVSLLVCFKTFLKEFSKETSLQNKLR